MAIRLNFTYRGVVIPQAYIRINHITGGKYEDKVTPNNVRIPTWRATVGVYASATEETPIVTLSVTTPLTNMNQSPFVSLYAALKAMPEFAGAVDVLEE